MVGDETTPLAASQNIATTVPDDAERESPQLETEAPIGMDETRQDGNESITSAVSSITGDHHTVSDVEEGEDGVNNEEGVDTEEQEAPTGPPSESPEKLLGCDNESIVKVADVEEKMQAYYDDELKRWVFPIDNLAEAAKSLAPPPMVPEKTEDAATSTAAPAVESPDKTEEEKSESSDLVETLSNMGFEKEQIEKSIGDMREAGATEIDADSVISEMMGEMNDNGRTWDFVESTVRDFERQHEIRRRTQNIAGTVSRSAKELWSNVRDESQRFRTNLRGTCDQADVQARTASTQVKYAASSAKDSICRANGEYRIAEKVATAAVVGGALLIALGSPRAGVGAMAVAGASVAAGEAMKHSSTQSTSTYTRDHGLGEGVHLD